MRNQALTAVLVCSALLTTAAARAETPADFLKQFEASARQSDTRFSGFSAERGEQFFKTAHGMEWSCSSCHTQNPAAVGKHAKTGKEVAPLAPAANPERFSSPNKVEKWFKRNCNDVVGRACTPQEKGDVLAYVMSIKK